MQEIKRIVPHDDPVLIEHYADLLAKLPPDVEIVETTKGTYRFKRNPLVDWIFNDDPHILTRMCVAYQEGAFPLEEYMEFYRGLGYSLQGFIEVFGEHLWPEEEAEDEEME